MIRIFYDAAVTESGAATETQTAEQPSLASLMAKSGHKTENSPVTYTKEIKEENNTQNTASEEKPKVEEKKIAETATSNSETGKTETPKQGTVATETPKPIAKEQPKQPTLQEVLKGAQPDAVLKALGFDDKVIGIANKLKGFEKAEYFDNLLDTWKTNGDVKSYFKELSTDYAKMPSEEVLRQQLQRDYPKANPKQLEALFRKEIVEKYNLNSQDEDERNEGILLLDAKADQLRDDFIKNQQKFLTPTPPEPKTEIPDNTEQLRQQELEGYKSSINESSFTKELLTNKGLNIGEGDDKYFLPIETPQDILDILFDNEKWAKSFFNVETDGDGNDVLIPDVEKQLFVAAAIKDYKGLIGKLAKHFKTLGGKAAIDPIDNAKPKENDQSSKAAKQPESMAEAMAKSGKISSGKY